MIIAGGVKLGDGSGTDSGDQVRTISLAVLHQLNRLALGGVLDVGIGVGNAAGGEHVAGVDLGSGTGSTGAEGLALEVSEGVHAGLVRDSNLHDVGVNIGDGGNVVEGLTLESALAVKSLLDNAGLTEREVGLAFLHQTDVLRSTGSGLSGSLEPLGSLVVEQLAQAVCNQEVGAAGGSTADLDGVGGGGSAVGGSLITIGAGGVALAAAGDQGHGHDQGKEECEDFLVHESCFLSIFLCLLNSRVISGYFKGEWGTRRLKPA